VFSSADVPNVILDVMVTSPQTASAKAKELQAFVRAVDQAQKLLAEKPDECVEILAKYLSAKPEDVTAMLKGVKIYGLADNAKLFGASGDPGTAPINPSLAKVVKFLKDKDAIKAEPKPAELLNASVVRAAGATAPKDKQ
jgi:NitT/TauT family transport system substrate-binding protein